MSEDTEAQRQAKQFFKDDFLTRINVIQEAKTVNDLKELLKDLSESIYALWLDAFDDSSNLDELTTKINGLTSNKDNA